MLLSLATLSVTARASSVRAGEDDLRLTPPESVGMSTDRLKRIGVVMRKLIAEEKIPGTVTIDAPQEKLSRFSHSCRCKYETTTAREKKPMMPHPGISNEAAS